MSEIIDYIMLRLYKQIFATNKILSKEGIEINEKIDSLQWLQPSHFGFNVDAANKQLWEIAVKELQGLDRCFSPKTK